MWNKITIPGLSALLLSHCLLATANATDEPQVAQETPQNAQDTIPNTIAELDSAELTWHDDYGKAVKAAETAQRMLFIFFYNQGADNNRDAFIGRVLADPETKKRLAKYELLSLPVDAKISVDGQPVKLLRHASFAHMLGRQGVAIMDMQNRDRPYFHHVVSTFPFRHGTYYAKRKIDVILQLPPGTLTQRTLVFAVRTHPEAPLSSQGNIDPILTTAAQSHSIHQASINLQGHHNWESRFHQLNAQLPGDLVPVEVAAESWPGETLVEAAEECVHSWRRSSGHWNAVRAFHPLWGYDMKRGSNGIWYATGIFGKRR